MKFLLKSLIAIVLFLLFTLPNAGAQKATPAKDFVGIWEIQQKANIDNNDLIIMRFIKIFYADGSFVNLNLNPRTSAISHKGSYSVTGNTYEETIGVQDVNFLKVGLNKSQKFGYHFSEDKNLLNLEGELKGKGGQSIPFKETWTRIGSEKP